MRNNEISSNKPYLFILIFAIILLLIEAVLIFLPKTISNPLIKEDGLIEFTTVILYLAAVVAAWILAFEKRWKVGYSAGLILLVMAFRELDFHNKFVHVYRLLTRPSMSLLNHDLYLSHEVPLKTKIVCSMIILAIVILVLKFILDNWRQFIDSLRKKTPSALCTFLGISLLLGSQLLDAIVRSSRTFGLTGIAYQVTILEETFELAIPLLFLLALIAYGRKPLLN